MKKVFILLLVILIVSVSWFILFKTEKKRPSQYKTEKIITGDISEEVTALGTVNPIVITNVGAQVSGLIKKIYVDFNSPVKKGQILAQIDTSTFEAQVEQSKANLNAAKANLKKIESIANNDKIIFERNKSLYSQDFIPRSDLELAETNYKSDLAQVDAAKAQILQSEAILKTAQTNLRYTKILSPVDGVVISRNIDVGQTVASSFQTPTLFLVAQDLTKMQIDTNVSEADIGKIKVGQDIEYTLDGYPNEIFRGIVKQIRNSPTTLQNVVTYDVVVIVDNKQLKLRPGMTANVSIITSDKHAVMLVNNACLRFSPKKSTQIYKTPGIWIVDTDNKIKRIPIKTGISDNNYTEIISSSAKIGQDAILEDNSDSARKKQGSTHFRMF